MVDMLSDGIEVIKILKNGKNVKWVFLMTPHYEDMIFSNFEFVDADSSALDIDKWVGISAGVGQTNM